MSLCLAAGGAVKVIATTAFTLAWIHSVEKVRWEETWEIVPAGLRLAQARIKGSGAGMEPGANATLRDGWWTWAGDGRTLPRLVLADSGQAGEWHICIEGACRPLRAVAGSGKPGGSVTLSACARAAE